MYIRVNVVMWHIHTGAYAHAHAQVPPLLDALSKNASLIHLDLSASGITWDGPAATGAPLIEAMHKSAAALSELATLVISQDSGGFSMPVGKLRAREGVVGLTALREAPLLSSGGPRRAEIHFMADLLREQLPTAAPSALEEVAADAVAKWMSDARRGKLKKDDWQRHVTQAMYDGHLRRSHLKMLLTAEMLRDVTFAPKELLAAGYDLDELRRGGFTGGEMRAGGLKAAELRTLGGYTAGQLKAGGFPVSQLKLAGYTAADLKAGGFVARQLKGVGFTAAELKENGFSCETIRMTNHPRHSCLPFVTCLPTTLPNTIRLPTSGPVTPPTFSCPPCVWAGQV